MFIAERDAKCSRLRRSRAGHDGFSQRQTTSSSSRCSALLALRTRAPASCHGSPRRRAVGMRQDRLHHLRDDVAALLDQRRGRPRGCPCARRLRRCAASPSRSSSRRANTGSSTAYGVTAPVRPTLTSIRFSVGRRLLRGELERRRPARKLRRRAEPLAQRQVVHLDDDAVGVEVERSGACRPTPAQKATTSSMLVAAPPVRLDRQAPAARHRTVDGLLRGVAFGAGSVGRRTVRPS